MRNTDLALEDFFRTLLGVETSTMVINFVLEDPELRIYNTVVHLNLVQSVKFIDWCWKNVRDDIVTVSFHVSYTGQFMIMNIRFKFVDDRLFQDLFTRSGFGTEVHFSKITVPLRSISAKVTQKIKALSGIRE